MSNPLILNRIDAFWNSPKSSQNRCKGLELLAQSIFKIARTSTRGNRSNYVEGRILRHRPIKGGHWEMLEKK